MNRDFHKYDLCFRITRAKSGVGFEVKPFDLSPVAEDTAFATCLEVQGVPNQDGTPFWFEVATRTLAHDNIVAFDDAAGTWLKTLWHEWFSGKKIDAVIAAQFEAIRNRSREILEKIEGKIAFTEGEFCAIADNWHEAFRQVGFWETILPSNSKKVASVNHTKKTGLVGNYGTKGGRHVN